jgi:hypothetical protein
MHPGPVSDIRIDSSDVTYDAEFLAVDRRGNVYGAEVPGERLVKYARGRR